MKQVFYFSVALLLISNLWCFADQVQTKPIEPTEPSDITKQLTPSSVSGGSTTTGSIWASPAEAEQLVRKAITYIEENGKEKAYEEFMNKEGEFYHKDLYVFVIDMDGNVLAHGGDEKQVGYNQLELKDSYGERFIVTFIQLMQEKDEAWAEYSWRNYYTHEIEKKLTFLKKIDSNTFIGCGAYYPE